MRRFALGCLGYTAARFGLTRFNDFMDAMTGHNERENERLKATAEIIRISTALLWNIQVSKKDKLSAKKLMPLPWDKEKSELKPIYISDEEMKKGQKRFEDILNQNGNSNNKP